MNQHDKALELMRKATGLGGAVFHPGQWESIEALLARKRMLVVQRTGWGKSMVYFVATKLLREQGAGVTLLISPLLSLMRNQLEASQRLGLCAVSINCTNHDEWDGIERRLLSNQVDLLLVSPERLANSSFQENVLQHIAPRVGLFVVDEAHCISDWGHDFRPDYRRITNVLKKLPPNIPVLATTATANDRVVADIKRQLGNIAHIKGPLARESLRLQNVHMPSPVARLAWMAQHIPSLPGSGIVYALTVRDARLVADWLRLNGIAAEAYYADLDGEAEEGKKPREELEQKLLNNEIKVLVATVALGMGFDKPDLTFVIHYQRPSSVVHYYQQVGRAGRGVPEALGLLMCGEEDDRIADYFIRNAFPPQAHVRQVLDALLAADGGLSIRGLEARLDVSHGQLEKALKYISVENPSPITRIKSAYQATQVAYSYEVNQPYVGQITQLRHAEQSQMRSYMDHSGCLMHFLSEALDDPHAARCGRCAGCLGQPIVPSSYEELYAEKAARFLRRVHQVIVPRRMWPGEGAFVVYPFKGRITPEQQFEPGRALSLWRDAGWGSQVADGKYVDGRFSDRLVDACVEMIKEWAPNPRPEWVTCIPSRRRPQLVPDFAERLAKSLGIPFRAVLCKARDTAEQKEMNNSFHQVRNLDGAFVAEPLLCLPTPCFLVDDMVDSRWTFTVAAAILRRAACAAVFPLALALNSPKMD